MARHEARIRARNRRRRRRRRRIVLALLLGGAIFIPNMIGGVYRPQPQVRSDEPPPGPDDSVARPPMQLRRGTPGFSVYDLIDLQGRPSWRRNPQYDWVRFLRLLGDYEQVIALEETRGVQPRGFPLHAIFDGRGPEVEKLDGFDRSEFAPDEERVEQLILGPPDRYDQIARGARVRRSPIPEPRPTLLMFAGLLGLAIAGQRRGHRDS